MVSLMLDHSQGVSVLEPLGLAVGVSDFVSGQPISVTIGDTEVLVETLLVGGTESTAGRAQRVLERTTDAFRQAQHVITEVAKSTAEMIETTAKGATRPDHVEIEFGLSFSATGQIVMVAGATAGVTIRVLLSYDTRSPLLPTDVPQSGQDRQQAEPDPAGAS
jgi:hypothetical protein